jgi:signal transduction histidine kinase
LGTSIRSAGQSQGILCLYGEPILHYTIEDINLFTAISDAIGKMVEREQLFRQAEQAAVTEERHRLARELHDSVTQMLYSLVLFCGAGRRALKQNEYKLLEQHLEKIDQTALQALKEMRLLVYELRSPVFQAEGLVRALQNRLESVEKRMGINVQIAATGSLALSDSAEFGLYRIAEEALNNALKHAKATSILVSINSSNGQVVLEVVDNGCGFDLETVQNHPGFGLKTMHERAHEIGGAIQLASEPGQGTRVSVCVKDWDK